VRALAAVCAGGLLAAASPVAALAAPGELDASYGTGGVFTGPFQTAAPSVREQYAVVDSQRRTVIAATHADSQGHKHLDVMRLTAQGALDTTFNPGGATPGVVEVDFGPTVTGLDVQARGVAVTTGDKVVALGWVNNGGSSDLFTALVRLGSDGSYDTTFGPNHDGHVVDQQNPNYAIFPDSLAVDSSGRILVGGSCGSGCGGFVARYTATGARDTGAFNASDASHPGVLVIQTTDVPSLATLSDGSVLVAGASALDANDALMARVRPDGTLDPTFNSGGSTPGVVESAMGSGPGGDAFAYGVAAGPGGSVYVTGQVVDNGSSMRILRLTSAGAPDAGFGNGSPATGVVTVPVASARGLSIAVDGSSCPVAVGLATVQGNNQILAARLTPAGQLDAAFNAAGPTPGSALFQLADGANGETIALQDDGNIVIGGYSQQGSPPDRRAIALRLQGGGCGASATPAPTVVTGQPSNVTSDGATFNGTVNPNGSQVTDCHFDYGPSPTYGNRVACSPSPGAGTSAVAVSATLSGLGSGKTWNYRLVATGPGGTSTGANQTMTTQTGPASTTLSTSQTWGGATGSSITIGSGATGERDEATITGENAVMASGTVTFALYSSSQCTQASQVFTSTNHVAGNLGPFSRADSDPVTQPLSPGHTYYWTAAYSGDSGNRPSASSCGDETLTVSSIVAEPPPTILTAYQVLGTTSRDDITITTLDSGEYDHAVIDGANSYRATGTVTFGLYSSSQCSPDSQILSSVKAVRALGVNAEAFSDPVNHQLPAGFYYWTVTYSGDSQNQPSSSPCRAQVLTVEPPPTTVVTFPELGIRALSIGDRVPLGATDLRAHAYIYGANAGLATGTVNFGLYSTPDCSAGSEVFFSTNPVSVGHGPGLPDYALAFSDVVPRSLLSEGAGPYYWEAHYSGNGQNGASGSPCSPDPMNLAQSKIPTYLTPDELWGGMLGTPITVPWWATGVVDRALVIPSIFTSDVLTPSGQVEFLLLRNCQFNAQVFRSDNALTGLPTGTSEATSDPVGQLPPGSYGWEVAYLGDISYDVTTLGCQRGLTVSSPISGPAFSTATAVTLPLTCPLSVCKLRVTMTVPGPAQAVDARKSTGKRKPPVVTLAQGNVTIRKHGPQRATLRLTSAGRRYIAAHHGRLTVTVTIATTVNGRHSVLKQHLMLKIARPTKGRQH
jgi:uncharacterized delta-60 repeat protein